jgi:Uma2 family endonuclease
MSVVLEETQTELITADELLLMPNTKHGCELVRGKIVRYMPTGILHGIMTAKIGNLLSNFVSQHKTGMVLGAETGFYIFQTPDTVRAPDAAFIGNEKLAKYGITDKFFPDAPDLAVEVVSPNDRKKEIEDKIKDYLTAGVSLVWVIYPQNRIVAVYRQSNLVSILRDDDELDGEDTLPDFRLSLSELFVDLPGIKPEIKRD